MKAGRFTTKKVGDDDSLSTEIKSTSERPQAAMLGEGVLMSAGQTCRPAKH